MRTVKDKGIMRILLTFLIIMGMFAGVCRPVSGADAAEDFRTWRQMDSRWGSVAIGGSTVRSSGCYITSIAMVAVASGARDTESFDPGVFAKQLNDIGAFNQYGGLISWGSVNKVVKEISIASANLKFEASDQSGRAAELKNALDKGMYVICNVGGHWVYIDGVVGDDVYMADPAKDEVLMFEAYKNEGIQCYQLLQGKEPYSGFVPPAEISDTTTSITSTTVTVLSSNTSSTSRATTAAATTTTAAAKVTSVTEKTTVSENTTTSKSTTASTEKPSASQRPAVTTVTFTEGEYYCSGDTVKVYADKDDKKSEFFELNDGNVVKVLSVSENFGEVKIGGKKGWVDLKELVFAGPSVKLTPGDINDDGAFDAYDLALINEYIVGRARLPEGVSVLTGSEIDAADLSGDGKIDNTDVLLYLMRICN